MTLFKINQKEMNHHHPLPKEYLNFLVNCRINCCKQERQVSTTLRYFSNKWGKLPEKNL